MESIKKIAISDTCDCSIYVSLRDIVDNGLNPAIQAITTIIAASLNSIFEKYTVDFIFFIGNIFSLLQGSPIYTAYTNMLQEAFDSSIELKENDTKVFMIKESLCQLLQPATHERPYMYDGLTIGSLYQVSKETYVLYPGKDPDGIADVDDVEVRLLGSSYKNANVNDVCDMGSAMVILRKGQMIPNTGLVKQFKLFSKTSKAGYLYFRPSNNNIIRFYS